MVTIEFRTDNAAFDGAEFPEIAEVLRKLADRIEDSPVTYGTIRDSNGNSIGAWKWEAD